jgi:hypothetical protein
VTSSPAPAPAPAEEVTYCQRHPSVETALRCGRCDALICPRCLVFTPAGTRCPDCARLRRPVMYELGVSHYLRAAGVALGLGLAMGVVGAFLVPVGFGGFLFLTLAVFGGSALGGAVAEALTRATRGKRGIPMQAAAVATLVLADVVRLTLAGGIDLVARDMLGTVLVALAAAVAWGRLR